MSSSQGTLAAKPSWQFGLKHLLVAAAFLALLLSPVRWLGGSYLVVAMFSLGFVLATILVYHRSGYAAACVAAFLFGGFAFVTALVAPAYAFHAGLNFLATFVVGWAGMKTRHFALVLGLVLLGFYGWTMSYGFQRMAKINELKEQYPIVSLASRLDFEPEEKDSPIASVLAKEVDENLTRTEQDGYRSRWGRGHYLTRLHTQTQREFALATGFGFARMGSVVYAMKRLNHEQPKASAKLPLEVADQFPDYYAEDLTPDPDNPDGHFERRLHAISLSQFGNPDNLGYIAGKQEAAGFISHRFDDLGARLSGDKKQGFEAPIAWQLTRLELVGLLRHEQPVVYQSQTLPQMDQLADLPTRPLNDFESAALEKLHTQEDVVIEERPRKTVMLGSVRAAESCLQCHNGPRGRLLGAFSYELVPYQNATKPETAEVANLP